MKKSEFRNYFTLLCCFSSVDCSFEKSLIAYKIYSSCRAPKTNYCYRMVFHLCSLILNFSIAFMKLIFKRVSFLFQFVKKMSQNRPKIAKSRPLEFAELTC